MNPQRSSSARDSSHRRAEVIEREAGRWVARRDRGLSTAEQAEFARWSANPVHAQALAALEGPFAALNRASGLRPNHRSAPDPDLLIRFPTRQSQRGQQRGVLRGGWYLVAGCAAAAAMVMGILTVSRAPQAATLLSTRGVVVHHSPERIDLPDGSTIELRSGTRVETSFSHLERRVALSKGDAHFTVAKDPDRPFIVRVGAIEVRAVGTAFTVSATAAAVEVVVTEGKVRVGDTQGQSLIVPASVPAPADQSASRADFEPPALGAGQRLAIAIGPGPVVPAVVASVSSEEIERVSAWRSVWLEFGEMPLAEVAREFNRHARPTTATALKTADEATGRVLVSGTFRADGVDAFVRLLQTSFGVTASADADGNTVLRKRK